MRLIHQYCGQSPVYALLSLPVGLAVSLTPSDLTQNPSPKRGWFALGGLISPRPAQAQVPIVKRALKGWPYELPRQPCLSGPPEHSDLLTLCRSINETDVYEHYMASIHGAPEFRLSSGASSSVRASTVFCRWS